MTTESTLLQRATRAGQILMRFVVDHAARIRFGLKDRARLLKQIEAGKEPNGYRVDWVINTANRLLDDMRAASTEFNGRYPWDAISPDDMKDVLRTMMQSIEHSEGEDGDDEEPL